MFENHMKCIICNKRSYSDYCLWHKPPKRIATYKRPKQQSARELDYQEWKETVARPTVIERDGNRCNHCYRPAREGEKLDLDHVINKGSHPELKRSISNLRLMCRKCHRLKTDRLL